MKKLNKIKGSAVLVVIFCAISFFIYTMSTYAQTQHFSIIQDKYEKMINEKYNTDEEKFYVNLVNKNTQNIF